MSERRFYWLKLKEDFFDSKRIKKLRKMAGGDTMTIIYLKMQLKSINNNGIITYTGLEKTFAEELALDLDETPEDVGLTLNYLLAVGLIETSDSINFLLPYAQECIGSESAGAERVRNFREREKQKALQSNATVTEVKRIGNVEIDIEKEIDIDIDKEKKRKVFMKPTVEEVRAYCAERRNGIDPEAFIDHYDANGWKVGKNPMKDWKAAIRNWERQRKERGEAPPTERRMRGFGE